MALDFFVKQQEMTVVLQGDLQNFDDVAKFDEIRQSLKNAKKLVITAKEIKTWNSSIVACLYRLIDETKKQGCDCDVAGLPQELQNLLKLAMEVDRNPKREEEQRLGFLEIIGEQGIQIWHSLKSAGLFLKDAFASILRFAVGKAIMRKVDFEFALEDCGYKAIGIVSLVSFMVGLILAFVGALQLKMFGAQIYIASLVAIGMTRIMGAIMAGIIIAGRTGASYAATIGTMQVNEEIDALKTMGIPVTDFLVLPRMLSLIITMPFLTMLADIMGMIGGAFVAVLMLDISAQQYWIYSVEAFQLTNFLVGIFHGFMYGVIISCAGCYYGVNCGRNADSVGVATTKAVVSSIVIMIVATGILTSVLEILDI